MRIIPDVKIVSRKIDGYYSIRWVSEGIESEVSRIYEGLVSEEAFPGGAEGIAEGLSNYFVGLANARIVWGMPHNYPKVEFVDATKGE